MRSSSVGSYFSMGRTGSRYSTPIFASGIPPTLLAITGTPRSMASSTARDRASAHSDGTSSTRVRFSNRSMLSTGSITCTFASLARAARSCSLVPHVGTAAKRRCGMRAARSRKIEMPLTAHGFTSVTNSFSKLPSSGYGPGSISEIGT